MNWLKRQRANFLRQPPDTIYVRSYTLSVLLALHKIPSCYVLAQTPS